MVMVRSATSMVAHPQIRVRADAERSGLGADIRQPVGDLQPVLDQRIGDIGVQGERITVLRVDRSRQRHRIGPLVHDGVSGIAQQAVDGVAGGERR